MGTLAKKINISVPNPDEKCFALSKEYTREKWQQECKKWLLTDKDRFNQWQNDLATQPHSFSSNPSFFSWNTNYVDAEKPSESKTLDDKILMDLSNIVFDDDLNLEGFEFRYPVWFGGVTFKNSADFKAIFHNKVYFVGTTFENNVNFSNTTFIAEADFSNSIFGKSADFSKATFTKYANFCNSIFTGYTDFFDCKFKHALNFRCVEFHNQAHFYCTEFALETDFSGAIFKMEVDFSGDRYDKDEKPEFDKLQAFSRISFDGVCFEKRATFNNRQFTGTTSFGKYEDGDKKTKFHYAPHFHNCKLYQGTTFVDADFDTLKEDVGAAQAFNTLKLAMSQQQSTRDEYNFIQKELETERLNSDSGKWLLYSLYLKTSNYGFSVKKPLFWLLLVPIFICGCIYGLLTGWSHCDSSLFSDSCHFDYRLFASSLEFSVLQNLPPLGLDRYSYSLFKGLFENRSIPSELFLGFIIALQKILALFCWFFVVLALRNLFKMK